MRRILLILIMVFLFSGCSVWKEFSRDYMGGDKYYQGVYKDAAEEFTDDYWKRGK